MSLGDFTKNLDIWIVAILVIVLLVILIIGAVKGLPVLRKFAAFVNDVSGEEARPGRDRQPGLFERIATMEKTQRETLSKVEVIHHEVFPNSGKSLRDQTNRIEQKVTEDYRQITALKEKVDGLEGKVASVEGSADAINQKLDTHLQLQTGMLKTLTEEEQ